MVSLRVALNFAFMTVALRPEERLSEIREEGGGEGGGVVKGHSGVSKTAKVRHQLWSVLFLPLCTDFDQC